MATLASAHPYRERLRGLQMLALYRSGRQAEALAVFRQTRALLADELGVEPGSLLRRMHEAVLRADDQLERVSIGSLGGEWVPLSSPSRNPTPSRVAPRELPHPPRIFVGRGNEVTRVAHGLALPSPASVAVWVISGPGGVGKSSLAVHTAHQVTEAYPDGQLYVDLRGATPGVRPVLPAEVLGRFLRALGVDNTAVPADADEAAALFRTWVTGRRLLVVLDNAANEAQVRPLLPGAPGCGVLVTSDHGAERLVIMAQSAGPGR